MNTIWKFSVPASDTFTLELPVGARFLDVQMQYDTPQCWFLLDQEAKNETRKFVIVGTGHPVPEVRKLTYLGTFQLHGGQLVFHLFEYDRPRVQYP